MNQQPKTSYQEFLKDIYSTMKKINQTTSDIFTKLDTLDVRIGNLEKSYVLLSEDVKKIVSESGAQSGNSPSKHSVPANAKLLSLLTQLNDSANDITDAGMDVYTLGTNTALETVLNSPKLSPSYSLDTNFGLSAPDTEANYGLLSVAVNPVKSQYNIHSNNVQNDGFMILE